MKKILVCITVGLCTTAAMAQASNCATIKADKQRLACYDKASTAKQVEVPASVSTVAAKPDVLPQGVVFRSRLWHVNQKLDAMTDKKNCTALYKNAWTVQGTADTLYVSLGGRGGVKAYTLRVDDAPADSLQLATELEKKISAVDLQPSFDRIYNAKRVRLQVNTILDSLLVEDIDLSGFKEAVDYIRANCRT